MKKFLTISLICCLALALCACGDKDNSSSAPSSVSTPTPPVSTPDASTSPTPVEPGEILDLDGVMAALADAAGLTETVPMMELDLKAGGVDTDAMDAFVGVQAQNYSDNGGLVMVIRAKSGQADTIVQGLEAFKASRMDERYTEFANQVANTKEARIAVNRDVVAFVVSATGDWGKVDTALAEQGLD